jgi:hypothetical protein
MFVSSRRSRYEPDLGIPRPRVLSALEQGETWNGCGRMPSSWFRYG